MSSEAIYSITIGVILADIIFYLIKISILDPLFESELLRRSTRIQIKGEKRNEM